MKKYLRLFLTIAVFGLISAFSSADAQAADLPPLEDDPLAYYYSDEYMDRSAASPEAPESQENAVQANKHTYNKPSIAVITDENAGISHDERFDAAKIRYGIDVSYYQGDIDWNAVKSSGVEFVFIRVGYRGLTTGSLNNDSKFTDYMQGALAADLKVGVYFFSQAITPAEAEEEANFVLARIAGYNLSLPVVIDYEYGGSDGGRIYNAHLTKEQATSVCAAFCQKVLLSGYTPMVYANKNMLENNLDGAFLGEVYNVWLAHYTDKTSYANKYSYWQYTSDGYVPGISTRVDMDVWYDSSQMTLVGTENAKKYVNQVFNALLNRPPDSAGLATYIRALTQGDLTASRLITAIMESSEYKSKNYSDADFIKRAYLAMLGRYPSDADVNDMLARLNNGVSRRYVLAVLSTCAEFTNFCSSMKMERGSISVTENRDRSYDYTSYVMRCYEKIFNRKADVAGLNTWTGTILNGGGGVSVVCALVNSEEFRRKNYSNSEYIDRIYSAMLGRGADAAGKANWMNFMNQGVSPLFIVNGFCGSDEFRNLCAGYHMSMGSVTLTEPRDKNFHITSFVNRCYQTALLRSADVAGLNNWCNLLLTKSSTPEDIAFGFVFSPEANMRFSSNEAFLEMLYRLCLGRGADAYGKTNWMHFLNSGTSRYSVFLGFTRSDEFRNIIRQYGF